MISVLGLRPQVKSTTAMSFVAATDTTLRCVWIVSQMHARLCVGENVAEQIGDVAARQCFRAVGGERFGPKRGHQGWSLTNVGVFMWGRSCFAEVNLGMQPRSVLVVRCDLQVVRASLDVRQSHAGAETEFAGQSSRGRPAFLHRLFHVFDARADIDRFDAHLVRVNRSR